MSEAGAAPRRAGMSEAGAASTLLTHFDAGDPSAADPIERESSRPDLGALCYPVISMGEKTHAGSRQNLLGEHPSPELVRLLANELQVTKETPLTFLFHTAEDATVPVQNSLMFAAALADQGVPFALHIYPKGAHGIGLGTHERDPPPLRSCPPSMDERVRSVAQRAGLRTPHDSTPDKPHAHSMALVRRTSAACTERSTRFSPRT